MLKQRIVTALLLVLVLGVAALSLDAAGFAVFAALIVLAAAWEWAVLVESRPNTGSRSLFIVVMAGAMVALWHGLPVSGLPWVLWVGVGWWLLALIGVCRYPKDANAWGRKPLLWLMGLLVLLPCWQALVWLRQVEGLAGLFYVVAIVCLADIGAYFVGRAWGRRKLAPAVSPGKSWAGFWGGLVTVALLACMVWAWNVFPHQTAGVLLVATVLAALASVLGDLLESMLKRRIGIKDSGHWLPGHGGVLDRLDSLTAAAPVFALCWWLGGSLPL